MPREKDLKRLVRARMKKTGESYTAARLQLTKKHNEPTTKPTEALASIAGMSDASVKRATGREWSEWIQVLDASGAASKPHSEIAEHVSSLGVPSWWTQMVTVGYERIRGLRRRGQLRNGGYQASKSRTFNVPVARAFEPFISSKLCKLWLPKGVTLRSMTANKRVRLGWPGGTQVVVGFVAKGAQKTIVAAQHEKLADKAAADEMKATWGKLFDRLGELLS